MNLFISKSEYFYRLSIFSFNIVSSNIFYIHQFIYYVHLLINLFIIKFLIFTLYNQYHLLIVLLIFILNHYFTFNQ